MNIPWCEVCHGAPKGAQYGALACLGCIVFFRRAIVSGNIKRTCNLNCDILFVSTNFLQFKSVIIIAEKKNYCRSCRLQKCLKVGMNPKAIQHRDLIGPRKPIKFILKKTAHTNSNNCEINFNYLMELQRKQTIKWELYGRQNEHNKEATATDIRFVMSLGFQNATVWANHFEPFWSLYNDKKTYILSEYGIAFILIEQAIKTANEGAKGLWLLQTGAVLGFPAPWETEQEKIQRAFVNTLLEMLCTPFINLRLDKFEAVSFFLTSFFILFIYMHAMPTALEEYYATNYSKCNISYNYLATWQAVAYPSHFAQLISLPFQILAFYIILTRTPVRMKPMQLPLFLNHLFCASFDFCICTLSSLYVFQPIMAFAGLGFLSWIGIPFIYQAIVGGIACVGVVGSYVFVFESRSSSLLQNRFRISRRKTRLAYYIYLIAPIMASIVALPIIAKETDAAKLRALEIYPCPTREFFIHPLCVFEVPPNIIFLVFFFFLVHVTANMVFHVASLVYYLYVSPSLLMSRSTRKDQYVFLCSVTVQLSVPFSMAIIPTMTVLLATQLGYYRQEWMNLAIICFAFHGIAESIAIMLVHKPYREAIRKYLKKDNSIAIRRSREFTL